MPEEVFETQQPTQPVEQKSTDWPKMVLVAVLGLGLLAVAAHAGYWYGSENAKVSMQNAKTTPAVSQPTPKPTPTPTPTPLVEDETRGWKVYRSVKFDYEVRYPSEITLEDRPPGAPDYYDDVSFSIVGETQPEGAHFSDGLSISVRREENPKELDLSDWVEEKFSGGYPTVTKIKDASIGGLAAMRIVGYGVSPFDEVFLSQDRHVLIVGASYIGPDEERYKGIFDQILSTFKFLD